MEKPTGVIQKIIESLQQVNALNVYSPIEKDIILHNLRAAYMLILKEPVDEQSSQERVERIFDERIGELEDEVIIEEPEIIEEEPIEEDIVETQCVASPEEPIEEEQIEEEIQAEEMIEEIQEEELIQEKEDTEKEEYFEEQQQPIPETSVEEPTEVTPILNSQFSILNSPPPLHDDILEFIPDAKPNTTSLFENPPILKTEKKSLNDLLTENKDEQTVGSWLQQSYIPDLTKAIGINEKFTFIRELFHNSGVDFSNAIQKLNDCENIDAAFILMEDLKHQYLWDTTTNSYLSLCDLVRRRFLN